MAVEQRPWGTYEVLLSESDYKVKKIFVNPNSRFSLQYHNYREEYWTIVKGSGIITREHWKGIASFGDTFYIPKKGVHRLKGGVDGICFIEVQRGDCREDDIVRLEDDYGRIG